MLFLKIKNTKSPAFLLGCGFLYIGIFSFLASCGNKTGGKSGGCGDVTPLAKQDIALIYHDKNHAWQERLHYQLDTLMAKRARSSNFNGSILVAIRDTIVYENYFGMAYKDSVALSPSTASHIASVTKTFTAAAVMLLQEQGKLNIHDNVKKYIPQFPYDSIRLIDLLSHRSGLPNYSYFLDKVWADEPDLLSNENMVRKMCEIRPDPYNTPNTHFSYCNTNFALLAFIIEKVTKTRFSDYMRCAIFEPLGMKNTFVYDPTRQPILPKNASASYYPNGQRHTLKFDDGVVGDKNIYSTVQDLYRWERALSRGKVLTINSLEQSYTPYSNEHSSTKNYGLGWRMLVYPDQTVIFHNGWWHGNNSSLYRFLKDDITVISLSNKYNRSTYQVQPIYNLVKGYNIEMGFEVE
jgi:CubicO group peptidase (beta-lactamase class C family)